MRRFLIFIVFVPLFFYFIPFGSSQASSLGAFRFSPSVGIIEENHEASSRRIFLIQDAHTNASAQGNIAKTLDILLREEPSLRYIFLEGGAGDESLSFLRRAPGERREEVGLAYLERGELQGVEYFDLMSDREIVLWGVEDMLLYAKALDAYRTVEGSREAYGAYLNHLESAIRRLKPAVFNPPLLRWDEWRELYLSGEANLMDYFTFIIAEAERIGIDLDAYPEIKTLARILNESSLAGGMGDFSRLNPKGLLEDGDRLAERITRLRTITPMERGLVHASDTTRLLKRLLSLKLSPGEYAVYRKNRVAYDVRFVVESLKAFIMDIEGTPEAGLMPPAGLEVMITECEVFYELAFERDRTFVSNMFSKMEEEGETAAILVVGGFHAPHIKDLLRKEGVSFVSILPMISHPTDEERYRRILLARNSLLMPLRLWFTGKIYELAWALGVDASWVEGEAPKRLSPAFPFPYSHLRNFAL